MKLIRITRKLCKQVDELQFGPPVTHVYNPLNYARQAHEQYIKLYAHAGIEVMFMGMNPGPWGMAQTGVPFGEVESVRDWLRIRAEIRKPIREHPKRPIEGLACKRSEVSGRRVWGWARERFGTPQHFFDRFYIANFIPLAFMEETARNRTPDKLPQQERLPLLDYCRTALSETVKYLEPKWVIGIGKFAETQARETLRNHDVQIGTILHPSPASPKANRGWASQAEQQLRDLGIALPR